MKPTIALITVHGMGETQTTYAYGLRAELERRLSKSVWSNLHIETVYYQDILQTNQEAYFDAAKDKIDWKKLRRFMLYGFCDASSLETQKAGKTSPYFQTQDRIKTALFNAYQQIGKSGKVIVLAQSLGGQVFSNYLWDAGKKAITGKDPAHGVWAKSNLDPTLPKAEDDFLRGKNVHRLVTTGCNIPLFVAGRSAAEIDAIAKPRPGFKWDNYYDEDDVLGWPLEPLSPSYKKLVADHKIDSGGLFASWNPLSHTKYWGDSTFLNALVKHIEAL